MNRYAYLSGLTPDFPKWRGVKSSILAQLIRSGYDCYRPDTAFQGILRKAGVVRANLAVISQAQAGVVCVAAGVQTPQVPVEVERMLSAHLPVLIVTDLVESDQIDDWIFRGVQVCTPEDASASVKDLCDRADELAAKSNPFKGVALAAQAFADQTAKAFGPRPLVFEPVDLDTQGVVQTVSGPQHLLPNRGYEDDAGLDLYASRDVEIGPHEFVDVPSGVKIDIPKGHWAMITGRSSTLRKRGLLVSTGVIDAGWTGELFAGVKNLTGETVHVPAGDRLAQLILLGAPVIGLEPVWGQVPEKNRGTNGFGSTGL